MPAVPRELTGFDRRPKRATRRVPGGVLESPLRSMIIRSLESQNLFRPFSVRAPDSRRDEGFLLNAARFEMQSFMIGAILSALIDRN